MRGSEIRTEYMEDSSHRPGDPPETRYANASDGLSIAYKVWGRGPPDFLWIPGFASHLELFRELPGYAHAFRRLAGFTRFAVFDKRGTGLSDRSLGTGTLEARMRDVEAVMDAADFRSAVLLGASEGAALAILYAATRPERVEALVLLGGAVSGSWIPPSLVAEIEESWGTGALLRRLWLNGAGDLARLGSIERAMGTPRAMAEQMRYNAGVDATPLLARVRAPTLVLHCVDDPVVPVASGRALAAGIAGAKLVEVPGAFHGSNLPAEMDLYVDEVEEFLTGRRGAPQGVERVLSTVLITDIVGSTHRAAEMGDDRWAALMDHHDRVGRRVLERYRGLWIRSTGDGLQATFDAPARAVAAAAAMARELAPTSLPIRAGIHTGEIELRGDDIAGIAVHIAARIAALARDGEIWVSPTVPALVVGSGLEFDERGTFTLKGVPGEWTLSALR